MSMFQLPDGREMDMEDYQKRLAMLSEPFPPDQIEKLPRPLKGGRDQPRYKCRQGTDASADGYFCGGFHARSLHLDYVGHATITERLNKVDPFWQIDFMVKHPETGEPKIDADGTWFTMTVLGVTRPCIGDSGGKPLNGNGKKEIMGDAIRNGAMRFGVATYLWSKSEEAERRKLAAVEEAEDSPDAAIHARIQEAVAQGPDAVQSLGSWAVGRWPEAAVQQLREELAKMRGKNNVEN